jgi:ParB/RepB/Spo0J family partition protein
MAKNFGSAGSAKTFTEVAKASAEKANVITVKMISNDKLFDYPKNHEDTEDTADLENSMKELGFTDPIEVTSFGMEEGTYTIVSGHRRRAAGVKCKMDIFPCIIKSFNSETEIYNYVLLANSQRDSAKDPLLFCKRYKMHEEYLKSNGFKGAAGEEIAKRLGIGVAQANRYKQFNKVILPVWDMVRDEVVGMSSVVAMGTFKEDEQEGILKILNECLSAGETLTRDMCKLIIDGYKDGNRSYSEIAESKSVTTRDSGLPLNGFINTEPSETKDDSDRNRNDEVRREYDPLNPLNEKDPYADERMTQEDYDTINSVANANNGEESGEGEKGDKHPLTEEEKQEKTAKDIVKYLSKLDTCFSNIYTFTNAEEAEGAMKDMSKLFSVVIDEMYNISREFQKQDTFKNELSELKKKVGEY